ncbi:MAG: EamA family transporter, partial [Geminicoccaceae bacterium]
AILLSLAAGAFTAFYTLYDAFGVRHADNPFVYIAWVFFLGGFGFPFLAARRWSQIAPSERPAIGLLVRRGVVGALFAYVSFGSLMLATRLDHVGEAAALRATSIVYATAIGLLFLGEKLDRYRLFLIFFVFVGAMLVEFGHG